MKNIFWLSSLLFISLCSCIKEDSTLKFQGDFSVSGEKYDAYASYTPDMGNFLKVDTTTISYSQISIKKKGAYLVLSSVFLYDS